MSVRRSVSYRPSRLLGAVALVFAALVTQQTVAAGATKQPSTMRAAAIVNDTIISTYDLEQRVKLVMVTSGAQGADAVKRLRPQVLRQLVDETLQLQEAQKYNVKITQEDLDKNFKRIAQQNNISVDQIYKMLDENGISRSTLQNQIKADLAWQKLVQQRLSPRVNVTDDDVDRLYEQMSAAAGQTQYAVSEIVLNVPSPDDEDQVRQNIQSILAQLRSGSNFSALARQFSQAPSASNGGDIGFVTESQLPDPAVAAAVAKLPPGGISEAIRARNAYYIIGVREKKVPSGTAVTKAAPPPPKPQAAQKMKSVVTLGQVIIPMTQGASKAKQEQIRQTSIEIYRSINGCSTAGTVAKSHGARFQMVGQMSIKDLAPQFVKILEKTPNGRSTPPLVGQQGVEMYVICSGGMEPGMTAGGDGGGARVTAQEKVTKEEVENRLYSQELSMLARRYLRDLRRDATIEMRDN